MTENQVAAYVDALLRTRVEELVTLDPPAASEEGKELVALATTLERHEKGNRKRQQRSNVNGQEEMVSALWEFAREVIEMGDNQSFSDRKRCVGDGQLEAIRKAMTCISDGYGYRIVEIQ